jgi:hypothetical protein
MSGIYPTVPQTDVNTPFVAERQKEWLDGDSPAHVALRHIVLDKRLLNNIQYYLNFRYMYTSY